MSSQASVSLRQQLMIDRHVQGSVLGRTALYSSACGIYFTIILIFTEWMSNPESTFPEAIFACLNEAIYWAPGLMLLVPVVAYDLLRFTNRFAGPFFRLRREMQRLANDESEMPLGFRDGDYWVEIADDFNAVRKELIELRQFHAEHNQDPQEAAITQNKLFSTDDEDVMPVPMAAGTQ